MLNLTVAGFLSSDPKLVEVGQTQVANFSIPAVQAKMKIRLG